MSSSGLDSASTTVAAPLVAEAATSSKGGHQAHNNSGREKQQTSAIMDAPSSTVQRLYKDPYAEAISRRKAHARALSDSSTDPAAARAVKGSGTESGREPAASPPPPPPQAAPSQRQCTTVVKAPPKASARRAGGRDGAPLASSAETSPSQARTSPVGAAESCAECNGRSGSPTLASSPPAPLDDVMCVVLPEVPTRATPRVSAAVNGGRLDLRARGLTVLPCLHLSSEEAAVTTDDGNQGSSSSSNTSITNGQQKSELVVHGSGDAGAARLHGLNLRQNNLRTLLTPFARTHTGGGAPALSGRRVGSIAPRSTPLHFYVHVSSLDLTHNALTSIAGVEALRCLRSLRLAFNKLTSLAPLWASPYVAELEVLDVSSNGLTEIITADDVHALESHHVRVVTHPTQAHATTGGQRSTKTTTTYKSMRLRVLYASNNALRSIPSAVYTFSQLADLRLRRNAIRSVPESFPSSTCLPSLMRLDLSMNCLPSAVVDAVMVRVAKDAVDGTQTQRIPMAAAAEVGAGRSRPDSGNSSRQGRRVMSTSPSPSPTATADAAAVPAAAAAASSGNASPATSMATSVHRHSARIQLDISHNQYDDDTADAQGDDVRVSEENSLAKYQGKSTPYAPPSGAMSTQTGAITTASAIAATGGDERQPTPTPLEPSRALHPSSPPPSHSLRPRRQRTDSTVVARASTGDAAPSISREAGRTPTKGELKAAKHSNARAGSNGQEEGSAAAPAATTSPTAPKRARHSVTVADAASSSTLPGRALAAVVPAPPPTYEDAVESLAENVYCVNLRRWASALQHKLAEVLRPTADPEDAPMPFTSLELLTALSDSVGSCVTVPASLPSAASTSTAGATASSKSSRPRLANTARVLATLLQCLPPANTLSFPEETQTRSPPLLILTGISAEVAENHRQLLLYELLAHHLIQHCLCTPKTASGTTSGGAAQQPLNATASPAVSPPPEYLRTNSFAKDSPSSMYPPTASGGSGGGYRPAGTRAGRSAGGIPGTASARVLAFHVPLQVVHVLGGGETRERGGEGSRLQGGLLLWGYLAWRRCWDAAWSRRRLKRHDTFVFEATTTSRSTDVSNAVPPSPPQPELASPTHCAAELYPFACGPASTRLFEWRRLRDVRPATYSPLPAPWDVLQDQLASFGAAASGLPPILSGCSDRMASVRGCPVSLACLLLCAVEHPTFSATSSSTPARPSSAQSPIRQAGSAGHMAAVASAAAAAASVRKRKSNLATAATAAVRRDAVAYAFQRQQACRQLAARMEAEATTIAVEQVQPCAIPTYNADEVSRSQQAASISFSQWTATQPTYDGDTAPSPVVSAPNQESMMEEVECLSSSSARTCSTVVAVNEEEEEDAADIDGQIGLDAADMCNAPCSTHEEVEECAMKREDAEAAVVGKTSEAFHFAPDLTP